MGGESGQIPQRPRRAGGIRIHPGVCDKGVLPPWGEAALRNESQLVQEGFFEGGREEAGAFYPGGCSIAGQPTCSDGLGRCGPGKVLLAPWVRSGRHPRPLALVTRPSPWSFPAGASLLPSLHFLRGLPPHPLLSVPLQGSPGAHLLLRRERPI